MSKFVFKWRKAVKGCATKSPKESLIDHDYLQPVLTTEEFKFEQKCVDHPVYNDYDILQHQTVRKNKKVLKEVSTNNFTKGFKRVFSSKSLEKKFSQEDQENLDVNNNQIVKTKKNSNFTNSKMTQSYNETYYCEIKDSTICVADDMPLIDFKAIEKDGAQFDMKSKFSESKSNLSNKFENDANDENYAEENQNLNQVRQLDTFVNPNEAFHWYLNLLFDTKTKCIQNCAHLNENERYKRLNICTAHLLYARNFYEMRIANSASLRTALHNLHPCLIALACLLDSDAVRIVESHSCSCDSYIYLFSTRLKFCAWKAKLYIILKRPKRSSIDRLNLIEDLTNCHKTIKESA